MFALTPPALYSSAVTLPCSSTDLPASSQEEEGCSACSGGLRGGTHLEYTRQRYDGIQTRPIALDDEVVDVLRDAGPRLRRGSKILICATDTRASLPATGSYSSLATASAAAIEQLLPGQRRRSIGNPVSLDIPIPRVCQEISNVWPFLVAGHEGTEHLQTGQVISSRVSIIISVSAPGSVYLIQEFAVVRCLFT